MTNAVDDELIATNNNTLRLKFLNYLCTDFDIKDMGIAHWCLHGRLLQMKTTGIQSFWTNPDTCL